MDASLLPTISFPAFSTHEEMLYQETKNNVISELKGNYGFKRYIRDGYKTVNENSSKRFVSVNKKIISPISYDILFRYYHEGEIKNFENIECEWPIFYIFMIIDGVFKTLPDQIQEYQDLLKERIMIDHNGGKLII